MPLRMRVAQVTAASAWAVADQAVVSLGSFLFTVVVARTFSERDFGTVVLALGGLHLLHTIHRSLLLYPYSLRVSCSSEAEMRCSFYSALVLSILVSTVLGTGAASVAAACGYPRLSLILGLVVLASQTQEVFRWALLSRLSHKRALAGDLIRHALPATAVGALAAGRNVETAEALGSIVVAAAIASVVQACQLRLAPAAPAVRACAAEFWKFGRWDLMSALMTNVSSQAMQVTLAITHGTVEVARLQAVATILGATHPVLFGLGNVITPAVARAATRQANPGWAGIRYALAGTAVLIPYLSVLALLPQAVLASVYGADSDYAKQTTLLRWFVAIYALLHIVHATEGILKGLGRSREMTGITLAGLVLNAAIVMPSSALAGASGGAAACVFAYVVQVAMAVRLLRIGRADGELPRTALAPLGSSV